MKVRPLGPVIYFLSPPKTARIVMQRTHADLIVKWGGRDVRVDHDSTSGSFLFASRNFLAIFVKAEEGNVDLNGEGWEKGVKTIYSN